MGCLATCSHDRTVRVWGLDGRSVAVLIGPNAAARACVFHPLQPLLAVAYHDGTVILWRALEARRFATLPVGQAVIRALDYDDAGVLLAAADDDGSLTVILYD